MAYHEQKDLFEWFQKIQTLVQLLLSQSTIQRYLNGERGKEILFINVLALARGLEVSMVELAAEMGEETFARTLEFVFAHKNVIDAIAEIYEHGGSAQKKLEADLLYLNYSCWH